MLNKPYIPEGSTCDICGRSHNLAGVASSPLGPISLMHCFECLSQNAHPTFMLDLILEQAHGDPEMLDESVESLFTWHDGKYVTWNEWLAYRQTLAGNLALRKQLLLYVDPAQPEGDYTVRYKVRRVEGSDAVEIIDVEISK